MQLYNQILNIYWQASFHRSDTVTSYKIRSDAWNAVKETQPAEKISDEVFKATFPLDTIIGNVKNIHLNITAKNTKGESYPTSVTVSDDLNTTFYVASGESKTITSETKIGARLWVAAGGKVIIPASVKLINFPKHKK